jgi:YbbR domain-containing protein
MVSDSVIINNPWAIPIYVLVLAFILYVVVHFVRKAW